MHRWPALILTTLLLTALLGLLVHHAQYVTFNFDEHQFVAAGALLARRGAMPFLDYAYYHLPNLALIDAGVFLFVDDLLASARAVSAVGAWLAMAVVVVAAMRRFGALPLPMRLLTATALPGLMMATPLFVLTSGKAWNQDLPLAAAMLALVALWRAAVSRRRTGLWGLACGALLGLAIGARITYAPLLIGFLLLIPLMPRDKDARLQTMSGFLGGGGLTLLPTILVWLGNPAAFWYGVLQFPLINIHAERADTVSAAIYPVTHRAVEAADKLTLLHYWCSHPPTLLILVVAATVALPGAIVAWRRRGAGSFAMRSASLTAVLILAGALTPQPMYGHYLYPAVPPMVLCIVLGAVMLSRRLPATARRTPQPLVLGTALCGAALGVPLFAGMLDAIVNSPPTVPQKLRIASAELARTTDAQRVLTLSPITALEAGRDVYNGTVTGPLPYRMTPFVPEPRRQEAGLLGPDNLALTLADDPPAAILTGVTLLPMWEDALVRFAKEQRYRPVPLGDRRVLWRAPEGEAASTAAVPVK